MQRTSHEHRVHHIQGTEVFCYEGHAAPVNSVSFSPTGRYIVSCSDIGERAIRVWLAGMPQYDREPTTFGMRLRWGRSGLVKRLKASTKPQAMDFFLTRREEREWRESSDESAGEKVKPGRLAPTFRSLLRKLFVTENAYLHGCHHSSCNR